MKREFNLVQSGQARFAKVNNYTKIWRIKCKLGKRGKRAFQAKRIHTQTRQVLEGASRSQVMHWSPGRWSPRLASLTCDLCDNTGPISQKGPMLNTILCCCHPEIPKDFILEFVFGQWSMSGSNEDRQGARHTYTSLEAIWGARGPQAGCGGSWAQTDNSARTYPLSQPARSSPELVPETPARTAALQPALQQEPKQQTASVKLQNKNVHMDTAIHISGHY